MASAQGINPDIIFNFNENNATTIRDYSEKGNDGTGTNLTVSATDRTVGYDAVFNGIDSELNSTISAIDDSFTIALAIKLQANTDIDYIFDIDGGEVFCDWDGTSILFSLDTGDGTFTLEWNLDVDIWYDIVLKLDDATGKMYIIVDRVTVIDKAVTGIFSLSNADIEIGHSSSTSHGKFLLNEFKLFQDQDTTTIDDGFIDEQNGVLVTSGKVHGFDLGDIIGYNPTLVDASYAIVTFVGSTTQYRIQPISDNITNGMVFKRCGNVWNTDRQWMLLIDNTPQVCFYDGITQSSEVGIDSKKTYCMGLSGLINPSVGKTDDYTLTNEDHTVYLTGSTAKTFTMPAAPTDDNEWNIINLSTAVLTIAASSINGASTQNLISKYDSAQIKYINSEFVIK